jgi:hypothetical protein
VTRLYGIWSRRVTPAGAGALTIDDMGSLHELATSLLLVGVMVGVFWAVRRFSPPFRCPHCGSTQLIFLTDVKECSQCGRWFV